MTQIFWGEVEPFAGLNKRAVSVSFGPCWRTFTSVVKYFVLFLDEKN